MSHNELVITPMGSPVMGKRVLTLEEQKELKERSKMWSFCCSKSSKEAIIYFTQITIMSVILIYSLCGLALEDDNQDLYKNLLSLIVGIILPSPSLKK